MGAARHRPARASPSAAATIASQLVLGGPPECPEREPCLLGLQSTYGLTFKEFKPLDVGGPLTVAALEGGSIDVGLLFTSDPSIASKGFVLLEDDKQLQTSDNIAPVVRDEVLTAHPRDRRPPGRRQRQAVAGGAHRAQQAGRRRQGRIRPMRRRPG